MVVPVVQLAAGYAVALTRAVELYLDLQLSTGQVCDDHGLLRVGHTGLGADVEDASLRLSRPDEHGDVHDVPQSFTRRLVQLHFHKGRLHVLIPERCCCVVWKIKVLYCRIYFGVFFNLFDQYANKTSHLSCYEARTIIQLDLQLSTNNIFF